MTGQTFGIQTPPFREWPRMVSDWQRFENLGWDSIWLADHFLPTFRRDLGLFESWTLLSALAANTKRVRLGVLVSCNTFRHPSLLAKQAATVDHISGGRLELGIGTGWVEFEHIMFGLDYPDGPTRVSMFSEAVELIDMLLRQDVSSYQGKHYRLDEAIFRPAPIQRPRPPMTLAAHAPRMLKSIAPYVDRWNSMGSPLEMKQRGERLDEALVNAGRDPGSVIKSLLYVPSIIPDEHPWDSLDAFADFVGRYAECGVTDFILQPPYDETNDVVDRVSHELLPSLR